MIRLPPKRKSNLPSGGAGLAAIAALSLATAWLAAAYAQDLRQDSSTDSPTSAREVEKLERERELEALRRDLARAKEEESKLKAEIDAIRDDHKKLGQSLVDTVARIRSIEATLSAAEARLPPLDAQETEIRGSLESRREVLAEVLAAVVRLSRRPAPALILRPEEALASVRSAMLLGAVVPELRTEAEILLADLTELARVRRAIVTERNTLQANHAALEQERRRLAALVDERQRRQAESEKALASERARAHTLARQVETVSELIARIEREIDSAARAAAAAREQAKTRSSLAALSAPDRIAPARPFAEALGRLPLPVSGTIVREFGANDGVGAAEKGISVATRPGTQVTSPCDGLVVYAGLFRSYGRLLIINAGGGYHVLLAGMEQITVELGQFVLTGEPVAAMGGGPSMVSATTVSPSQPILYIEFRKDGNSIDPSPWWATTDSEKARG